VSGKPKKSSATAKAKEREDLLAEARKKQSIPDPLSPENLKKLGVRIGIPVLVGWVIAFLIPHWIAKAVMGVITVAIAGILVWAFRYASKSRAVVDILKGADTPEGRKEALQKLESDFKKDDAAAVFARAQLEMQEDPRAALKTLEQINLSKVMAHVADEARAQRAMIHLILGETDEARALVDPIDLGRHQDARSRATLTAIIGEAWARTGQAKRAVELLEKLNPDDAAYEDLRPQLLRARAFAYSWANDTKQMRNTLRQLKTLNPQFLTGFITKKKNPMGVAPRGVHPLLEKEAFEILMKSGAVQRKMEMRRG
jgi:tetratricopeptide (TPR) repeat protein